MDEDAGGVGMVVGVAGNVIAAVDQQHAHAGIRRQPLGQHRAREAGADHQRVIVRPAPGRPDRRRDRIVVGDHQRRAGGAHRRHPLLHRREGPVPR